MKGDILEKQKEVNDHLSELFRLVFFLFFARIISREVFRWIGTRKEHLHRQ